MGPAGDSILQIHPTRRCNLRCLHCYSSSGPEERDQLPASVFERAIHDASEEGFHVASFSGGEPSLYRELPLLLRQARRCGMRTTVTSNGMLLHGERLDRMTGLVNVLAISLDGKPDSHNRMRQHPEAFERMEANLREVLASGIPFGFIFTLTQYNLDEAAWAAEFAFQNGAALFQIHALEQVGRAVSTLPDDRPDEVESAYAYLEVERIRRQYEGRMTIQFDLVHASILRSHPELFFDERDAMLRPLGELVSPLVIEADGRVSPYGYGFPQRFSLGCLQDADLPQLAKAWRSTKYADLQRVCRETFEQAASPRELPILNWWEALGEHAAAA